MLRKQKEVEEKFESDLADSGGRFGGSTLISGASVSAKAANRTIPSCIFLLQ